MFAFNLLLTASLFFSAYARPSSPGEQNINNLLCKIPILKTFLCPTGSSSAITRITPLGIAVGVLDPDGAYRFPVKYGSAARWQPSTVATSWGLPYVHCLQLFIVLG